MDVVDPVEQFDEVELLPLEVIDLTALEELLVDPDGIGAEADAAIFVGQVEGRPAVGEDLVQVLPAVQGLVCGDGLVPENVLEPAPLEQHAVLAVTFSDRDVTELAEVLVDRDEPCECFLIEGVRAHRPPAGLEPEWDVAVRVEGGLVVAEPFPIGHVIGADDEEAAGREGDLWRRG